MNLREPVKQQIDATGVAGLLAGEPTRNAMGPPIEDRERVVAGWHEDWRER